MRLRKKILVVAGVFALLIGATLFALSPPGLRMLAPVLERQLTSALGVPVELDGLILRWPLEVELAQLRAADSNDVYLDVRDVSLRVSARQLLRRNVWVHHLRAGHVAYNGMPVTGDQPERASGPAAAPDPAWLVKRVTIKEVRVEHLALGARILPENAALSVEGAFTPVRGGKAWSLSARLLSPAGAANPAAAPALRMEGAMTEQERDRWRVAMDVDARHWAAFVPKWPEQAGDDLHARLLFTLEGGRKVIMEEARVHTPNVEFHGDGVLDLRQPHLSARIEAVIPDAALFSAWLDVELEGAVKAVAELDGDPRAPACAVHVESDRVRVRDLEVTGLQATLKADAPASITHGVLSAEAVVADVPIAASTTYRLGPSRVSLSNLQARVLNAQWSGDVGFDWQANELQGLIHIEAEDIADLAAHWDIEAQGRVVAVLRMTVEEGRHDAVLEALASEVVLPYGAMETLSVEAHGRDVFDQPGFSLNAHLQDVAAGDLDVHRVRVSATGTWQAAEFELSGSGGGAEPWRLASAGSLRMEQRRPEELMIHSFSFERRELVWALEQTVRFLRAQDRYVVEQLAMRIGEGRLRASGSVRADEVEWSADVEGLPLSMFGFAGVEDAQGEMEGRLRVRGHPADPRAELQLRFSGLLPANTNYWVGPPAVFSVTASLEDRRVSSRFLLDGLTGRPVQLELELPLHVSLYPVHLQWPPEGEVSGRLFAETDLGELATLYVLDVHRLAGTLSVDLTLSGTVDEPDVSGQVRVIDGAYEHARWGTILRDLEMSISGRRDRLSIDHVTATDGNNGRLELSGDLLVKPEADYPFNASLKLEQFRFLRHDTAHAAGHGAVTWEGNRRASRVAGRVTVSPMELRIPERLPAALIDLDVIEINGAEVPDEDEEAEAEAELLEELAAHTLALDVEVAFPERAFVRGRGLDSEWGGEVQVQGTARKPEITGSLSVLRGRFVFFGKRLGISRGVVTLDGAYPPRPMIDVVAEARSGGITAILRLAGDMEAPEIQLDSVPQMPEDEILARLLFGREAARITPWQAITMAQAVNRLRGGGSAFDVMGETRRILRVDQIEVRESDELEGQAAVSVGKYVSDRVYVELERGVGAEESGRATVEVELTPTIRVESEMGTNADAALGFIWSWDY